MKILITGGTGFVGSHLSQLLERQGHEVYCLCRNKKKFNAFNVKGTLIKGSLHPKKSHEWVDQLPEDLEAIVHSAGVLHTFDTHDFQKYNIDATNNLLWDLKDKYKKLHFIFISSLAATGPSQSLNTEDIPSEESSLSPVSEYGQSKKKAEELLNSKIPQEWALTIIRPPMVIGPHDPAMLDIFKMVQSKVVLIPGLNGIKANYSFVCVYDLVDFIHQCLKNPNSGGTYFCAHPTIISFKDIIEEIKNSLDIKKVALVPTPDIMLKSVAIAGQFLQNFIPLKLKLTPDKYNELKEQFWVCDSKKSEAKLDMHYRWDLTQTIQATTKDYQKRGWL